MQSMISIEEMSNLFKDGMNEPSSFMIEKQLKEKEGLIQEPMATLDSCSPSQIALGQTLAAKHCYYFVSILNQQYTPSIRRFFEEICTPTTRIILQVHGFGKDMNNPQYVLNHFGTFTSADLSIEEFIRMLSSYWEIVPDEFMVIFSSHSTWKEETAVYISCFRSIGTIVPRDSQIGIGDMNGQLCHIRLPTSNILPRSVIEFFRRSFIAEGTLVMYRNQQGKINRIEFNYEFIV